jgi:hypothetical protein
MGIVLKSSEKKMIPHLDESEKHKHFVKCAFKLLF